MFCNQCGKELPDDAVFCSGCGNQMGAAATAEPVAEEPVANTQSASSTGTSKTVTVNVDLSILQKPEIKGNLNFAEFGQAPFWNQCIENAKYNMIALICCAVMFINVFLPFGSEKFFGISFNLLSAGGGIFIFWSFAGAVLAIFRMSFPLFCVGCLSALSALVSVIKLFTDGKGYVGPSIGFFILILAAAGLVAAPFITKNVLNKTK